MEDNFITVTSRLNPKLSVHVASGHFATNSAHRSHYIDIFELMSSSSVARDAARELAVPYRASTDVNVIVYMDGTEILAAYLADELLQAGLAVMNEGEEILLVTPMISADGHFIFHQSVREKIKDKNVVLMVASMSTGATADQVLECLSYYGCKLVGISAVFSAFPQVGGRQIHSLFDCNDIPDYHFFSPSECVMCNEGKKIDAIINSDGYTKL